MATHTFHGIVTTPAGTPLGGWVDVEVSDNGDYHVKFHMHSSSVLGNFDFNLRAYLTAPGFPMMAFIKSGHVSGVDSWDHEERGNSPLLALYCRSCRRTPRTASPRNTNGAGSSARSPSSSTTSST